MSQDNYSKGFREGLILGILITFFILPITIPTLKFYWYYYSNLIGVICDLLS